MGRSGLQMSVLSLGSWVTFGKQVDQRLAERLMAQAFERGVNFFDNAETYGNGQAEELMGAVFRKLEWPRLRYIVSTKLFWGLHDSPNCRNTLNRKYLLESMGACLKRLGLDHVDLVYCHRPDPETPIDETVWAMHNLIERGDALYWGTSEWPAAAISEALAFAERHSLHRPVVEQPQYSLLHRHRVELEYAKLLEPGPNQIGLTTWSPLASGVLTGKYLTGVPSDSRAAVSGYAFVMEAANDTRLKPAIAKWLELAREVGVSPAALAIAWCALNPAVSSVILGASRSEQLDENLEAVRLLERTSPGERQSWSEVFRAVSDLNG